MKRNIFARGSHRAGSLAALYVSFCAVPAVAGRLPMAAVVAEAKAHGFDIRVAETAVMAARADITSARALPNPTLSLAAGPSIGCWTAATGCRQGSPAINAQLSESGALWQMLVGKRALKEEVASIGLEVSQKNRVDAERQLVALVKQQFISTVVLEKASEFAAEVVESNRHTVELMRERYRAGAVDEADLSRVETQSLEAQQALDATRLSVMQEQSAMGLLLGRAGDASAPTELDATPFFPPVAVASLEQATVKTLVSRALESRADVRSQVAQVNQAQAAIRSVRRQRVPDLGLFMGYSQQGLDPDYSSPPNVTFGVSLQLPVAYRLAGEIAHAEASLANERVQLEHLEAQVRTEVVTAWQAYQIALVQVRRMNDGLLRSAGRARDLVSIQYAKGVASLLEFLDAQRTFVVINLEYLNVVQAYWAAVFRLEAALGQELPS